MERPLTHRARATCGTVDLPEGGVYPQALELSTPTYNWFCGPHQNDAFNIPPGSVVGCPPLHAYTVQGNLRDACSVH